MTSLSRISLLGGTMLLALTLAGCNNATLFGRVGKGAAKSHTRDLTDFKRIRSNFSGDVTIVLGTSYSVSVRGQDNIVEILKTEVVDSTLRIAFDKTVKRHDSLAVYITMPQLTDIDHPGSGKITVNSSLSGRDFGISLSGKGSIWCKRIAAQGNLNVYNGSTGSITIAGGSAKAGDLTVSQSGSIDATTVAFQTCTANMTGTGAISLYASQSLMANISGSGSITYKGNAAVTENITGTGKLIKQ